VKLYELVDPHKLKEHTDNGYVSVQKHPTLPLFIHNYTHKAQFDPKWGDGTIDYCRGLITDEDYNIVARPFKKFHNLNTSSIPETMEENLPREGFTPHITKKIDGSLGILWQFEGHRGIATRGSFTSPQAIRATKMYDWATVNHWIFWPEGYTPLFEIVYSENRIVVKYDFNGLVMIGMVNNETGAEARMPALQKIVGDVFKVTSFTESRSISELKNENIENEEGYVVTYHGPVKEPLKIKIKMADYLRLHKIVTGMNARSVWELLSTGKGLDHLINMPEHFTRWLEQWNRKLTIEFYALYTAVESIYINRPMYEGGDKSYFRKYRAECAAYFFRQGRDDLKSAFFAMIDGKDPALAIWGMIEPRGDDRSFREDGE